MKKGNATTPVQYSAGMGTFGFIKEYKGATVGIKFDQTVKTPLFSTEMSSWPGMNIQTTYILGSNNNNEEDDLLVNKAEEGHIDLKN